MPKTFLFDLDGTLIDSPPIIFENFKETFKKNLPEVELDYQTLTSFLGQTLFKTFKNYTNDEKLIEKLVNDYRKISDQKAKQLKTYNNAELTLKTLKQQGHNIGIVTSKMNGVAAKHLEITGLLPYVDLIVGYEDVVEHKPNPEGLLKAINFFKSNPIDTLYIGDHENDLIAAKKANIKAIFVYHSLRLIEGLKEKPDLVINDLSDLTVIF